MADNFYTLHQGHLMTYKHAVFGSHGSHFFIDCGLWLACSPRDQSESVLVPAIAVSF